MTPHMFLVKHKFSHFLALDTLRGFGGFGVFWGLEDIGRLYGYPQWIVSDLYLSVPLVGLVGKQLGVPLEEDICSRRI